MNRNKAWMMRYPQRNPHWHQNLNTMCQPVAENPSRRDLRSVIHTTTTTTTLLLLLLWHCRSSDQGCSRDLTTQDRDFEISVSRRLETETRVYISAYDTHNPLRSSQLRRRWTVHMELAAGTATNCQPSSSFRHELKTELFARAYLH